MEKKMENVANFGSQVIGYNLTNGTPFIIHPTETLAYMQGEISINDSREKSTKEIVGSHLDRYADVWQALA